MQHPLTLAMETYDIDNEERQGRACLVEHIQAAAACAQECGNGLLFMPTLVVNKSWSVVVNAHVGVNKPRSVVVGPLGLALA